MNRMGPVAWVPGIGLANCEGQHRPQFGDSQNCQRNLAEWLPIEPGFSDGVD